MRIAALALAAGTILVPAIAHAGRTELVVGGGINSPRSSAYRDLAEIMGYNRRSVRLAYEAEVGVVHAFNYWLSAGPFVRGFVGKIGSPYDDVPAIATYGVSIAGRVEADLFPSPRIFLWFDPSIGTGSIGNDDARTSVTFWGVRGGVGLGSAHDKTSIRFRIGYGYAPTTALVSKWMGAFDYGGWLFQIDGVLRLVP